MLTPLLRPALLHYAQQGKMKYLRASCCKTAEEKPDPAASDQTWVINMVHLRLLILTMPGHIIRTLQLQTA